MGTRRQRIATGDVVRHYSAKTITGTVLAVSGGFGLVRWTRWTRTWANIKSLHLVHGKRFDQAHPKATSSLNSGQRIRGSQPCAGSAKL